MPPAPAADALLPKGATALKIPSDCPASVKIFKLPEVPAAATAVRRLADVSLPDSLKFYHNGSGDDSGVPSARRVAFTCITPKTVPCRSEAGPFVRRVFRTLALDLPQTFELLPTVVGFGDVPLLFRTPGDRDAAMRRQPFVLEGVTVRLVPLQTILNVGRTENGYMVHVVLHDYPDQLRMEGHIRDICCRVGFVCEMDPACFVVARPDLSAPVRVVLLVEHPRQIPNHVRVNYTNGTTSVGPVEIVRVWDPSHSYDASGQYVPLFKTRHDARSLLGQWLRAMALAQGVDLN